MITADIIDQGTIDTTLPATSDPLYQMAALSLFYRQQWAALRTAGFNFSKVENSDFTTFNNELSTYLSNAYDRETEIIQTGIGTTIANLPDILSIGAAFSSGGASAAAACILNIVLGKLLGGDSGAQAGYEAKDIDTSELVTKLEEIREQIEQTLDEFNINLYNEEHVQSWSVGPVAEE